jgi:hypothetical protein
MAGTIALSGKLTGTPIGDVTLPPIEIPGNPDNLVETRTLELANGNNTIAVPSWAVGVVIALPVESANLYLLKGVTGDTGFQISNLYPHLINFIADADSDFVIHASAADTLETSLTFF